MSSFVRRRLVFGSAAVVTALLALAGWLSLHLSLRETGFVSGWVLLALVIGLALFNARKKLPFIPLLSASTWLQVHVYAGLVTVFVFLLHVEFRVPDGPLEVTLAVLFLVVAGSGVVGLYLSRIIPGRLRTRGERVIYERQPVFLRKLRDELAELVDEIESTSLSDFYVRRLIAFFAAPRNFWWHLAQSQRPRRTLLNELEGLDRYLGDQEREVKDQIADLIEKKDDLDYHFAHQAVLKYWLFVHIPLTYSLLIVAAVHAVVAYGWA